MEVRALRAKFTSADGASRDVNMNHNMHLSKYNSGEKKQKTKTKLFKRKLKRRTVIIEKFAFRFSQVMHLF